MRHEGLGMARQLATRDHLHCGTRVIARKVTLRGVPSLAKGRSLQDLQRIWYAKLQRAGFVDAERSDGQLVRNESAAELCRHAGTHPACFKANCDYYACAGQFLWDHAFVDPIQRAVWAAHADGMSYIQICRELEIKYHRVHAIVTSLQLDLKSYIAAEYAADDS